MLDRKKETRRRRLSKLISEKFSGKQSALSEHTGVPANLISRYMSGIKKIGEDMRDKIEMACGLPTGWLDQDSNSEANIVPGPDLRGKAPLISWVQAGKFTEAADHLQPGEALDWIDTTVQVRPHTFALRVEGDSMEPDFPAGMILVVEPDIEAHPGDYVIAKNGAEDVTFKQLVKDGADWYLKPLNPRYPLKPLGECSIVGVVREAVRRLR